MSSLLLFLVGLQLNLSQDSTFQSPIQNGKYLSKEIHIDLDGELEGLHHSGILGELEMELEYIVMDDFMAVTLKSNHYVLGDGQFKFTVEDDKLILDNGVVITVRRHPPEGYDLVYKDHRVVIFPN